MLLFNWTFKNLNNILDLSSNLCHYNLLLSSISCELCILFVIVYLCLFFIFSIQILPFKSNICLDSFLSIILIVRVSRVLKCCVLTGSWIITSKQPVLNSQVVHTSSLKISSIDNPHLYLYKLFLMTSMEKWINKNKRKSQNLVYGLFFILCWHHLKVDCYSIKVPPRNIPKNNRAKKNLFSSQPSQKYTCFFLWLEGLRAKCAALIYR